MDNQSPAPLESPFPEASKPDTPEPPVFKPADEKKSKNKLVPLLAFLLLVALGVTGYFGWQNYQLRLEKEVADVQPESSPVVEIDETADWELYTSSKANYSFKHPDTWPVLEVPVSEGCNGCVEQINFTKEYVPNSGESSLGVILVHRDSRINSLEDYKSLFIDPISTIINVEDTKVGIEKAVSYNLSGGISPLPIIEYVVVKNDLYYIIRLDDNKKTNEDRQENIQTFNQILSTFKFVDGEDKQNEYTNSSFNFSLIIPESWKDRYEVVEQDDVVSLNFLGKEQNYSLFSIHIVSVEDWNSIQADNRLAGLSRYLDENNGKVYFYRHRLDNPYIGVEADSYQNMATDINTIASTLQILN